MAVGRPSGGEALEDGEVGGGEAVFICGEGKETAQIAPLGIEGVEGHEAVEVGAGFWVAPDFEVNMGAVGKDGAHGRCAVEGGGEGGDGQGVAVEIGIYHAEVREEHDVLGGVGPHGHGFEQARGGGFIIALGGGLVGLAGEDEVGVFLVDIGRGGGVAEQGGER